jgi:uncharacterized protein (TIGR02145 family)
VVELPNHWAKQPSQMWAASHSGKEETMNRHSLLQHAIGLLFVSSVLSACTVSKRVPISTPTSVPSESTNRIRTVTDIDANVYHTVTIGTQVWMVENLKVTRFRNGDAIPKVIDNAEWDGLSSGAYCEYDNDISNVATYGRLYNWYAVNDSRDTAPIGWHVPTNEEWETLGTYLGGNSVAGGRLKEAGGSHWISPNLGASNSSGYFGLPGGIRASYEKSIGEFKYIGQIGAFWSSTELNESEAWMRFLTNYDGVLTKAELPTYKSFGYSVRCIKD